MNSRKYFDYFGHIREELPDYEIAEPSKREKHSLKMQNKPSTALKKENDRKRLRKGK